MPPETLDAAEAAVHAAALGWAQAPTRRARLTLVVAHDSGARAEVAQRLSSLDVPRGLLVARVDLAEPPPLPAPPAKPADRSWWDAAHRSARAAGAHQAALVDADGDIVDGSTSAIWIAEGGALITPCSALGIPSVSVAFVRARARRAGLDVRVEPVSWERFEAADEAFLTNAFGGAAPVRGRGGDTFASVAALFADAWAAG